MTAVVRARDGQAKILSWPELTAVIFLRVVVISVAVVVLSLFLHVDNVAFYALVAFGYIATIPYALWIRDVSRGRQVVPLQCVVDILLVTGLVYFTGGPESELAMLYPLVFLSAGILAGPTMAVEISVLGTLFYALMVVLTGGGWLPGRGAIENVQDWARLGELLGVRSLVFLCFGVAGAYISRRCRFADSRVEKYRELVHSIFSHVELGMVVADRSGRIYMVNPAACRILGAGEEDLLERSLEEFVEGGLKLEEADGRRRERPARFRRRDGGIFPARYTVTRIRVPGGSRGDSGGDESYLVVFSDVTALLELEEKVRMAERIQAAAQMASEIAHEIRNPLTAVSGSLELLDRLEKSAESGDAESAALLRRNRSLLYSQVVREAQRMNRVIQRFLDHAEFSPSELKRIMDYEEETAGSTAAGTR